jgi:hypothetical protein
MALALDVPFLIHLEALGGNDLCRQRQITCRNDYAVESKFQIALPDKVPGFLICLQVPRQHASSRKHGSAELLKALQVA